MTPNILISGRTSEFDVSRQLNRRKFQRNRRSLERASNCKCNRCDLKENPAVGLELAGRDCSTVESNLFSLHRAADFELQPGCMTRFLKFRCRRNTAIRLHPRPRKKAAKFPTSQKADFAHFVFLERRFSQMNTVCCS